MPFFDADRFARLLEREGFSSGQARAVINSLDDVVDERYLGDGKGKHLYVILMTCISTTIVTADLVSKADQERVSLDYGRVGWTCMAKNKENRQSSNTKRTLLGSRMKYSKWKGVM